MSRQVKVFFCGKLGIGRNYFINQN